MKIKQTLLGIALVIGIVLLAFWFFSAGDYETSKFLFTAGISDASASLNYFKRSETLSFVLNDYPYSLKGTIDLYAKIANENGWQINSGKDFNLNERTHFIEASKNGEHLFINLERLGGADKVLIRITHDR